MSIHWTALTEDIVQPMFEPYMQQSPLLNDVQPVSRTCVGIYGIEAVPLSI